MTGADLRRARERLDLTQAAMADLLGIKANSLALLERDERRITLTMEKLVSCVLADARRKSAKKRGKAKQ